jgi:twitching motility protein PilT
MHFKDNPKIAGLLDFGIQKGSSDLHLIVNSAPILRVDDRLIEFKDIAPFTPESMKLALEGFFNSGGLEELQEVKEVDFSFSHRNYRFRANIYYQKGDLAASFRLIPNEIRTFTELGLPPIIERFVSSSQGFVIVTGPAGHGKSTTLASMVEKINTERREHIITIEDPIEYVFEHKQSIISQREVGIDTNSFSKALRSALREDPDVILVGEMRDLETIEAALNLAETGHLVLTTLHTNSAAQTTDRIISMFPSHQQEQVRGQLASVLVGVISQRLLPKISGGRALAAEIMIVDSAIRNLIREGKVHQIPNVIQTSSSSGMISLDKVLAELVSKGDVSVEDAMSWALDPKSFKMMVY